jgi:hypothetical protein
VRQASTVVTASVTPACEAALRHSLGRDGARHGDGRLWRISRAAHHQRGVHRGVIRISGRAPNELVFELPLCVYRSGDRAMPG